MPWSDHKRYPLLDVIDSVSTLLVRVKIAFSMLMPFLKPNCSATKMWFDSRCCSNLLNIIISKIFYVQNYKKKRRYTIKLDSKKIKISPLIKDSKNLLRHWLE